MLGVNGQECCILSCLIPFNQLDFNNIKSSDFVHGATNWCGFDSIKRTIELMQIEFTGNKQKLSFPITFIGEDFDHGKYYPWEFTINEIWEIK